MHFTFLSAQSALYGKSSLCLPCPLPTAYCPLNIEFDRIESCVAWMRLDNARGLFGFISGAGAGHSFLSRWLRGVWGRKDSQDSTPFDFPAFERAVRRDALC